MAYIPLIRNARLDADAVTTDKVLNGTLTDADVAAANKDGVVATPSLRTIGTGAQQAMAGNTRLDTIAAPTGAVDMNGQLVQNVATPVSGTDAANMDWVLSVAAGLIDFKDSARAVATADVALTGTQTIDGVALIAGDRVLLTGQTDASENGLWVVAAGAWARSEDADEDDEVTSGLYLSVEEGTANADSMWMLTTNGAIVVGTTGLVFTRMPSLNDLVAGAGLTKTGNTLAVGQGTGITVNADDVAIDTAVVPRKAVANTFTAKQTFTAQAVAFAVKTANYSIDVTTDSHLVFDTTSGILTATLPAAHTAGDIVHIKRSGANNLLVATADADTIDASTSDFTMDVDLMALTFISDGTGWWVY